jgi:hypothetical protein
MHGFAAVATVAYAHMHAMPGNTIAAVTSFLADRPLSHCEHIYSIKYLPLRYILSAAATG